VARGGWRVAGKETRRAIVHGDFDLKNYQRHDYQKLKRGEP
jgi:hypothetical protein